MQMWLSWCLWLEVSYEVTVKLSTMALFPSVGLTGSPGCWWALVLVT
jgi:hypothetical protein